MGRAPCCEKNGLKKGPWTPEEDQKLVDYIQKNGYGNWRTLPQNAGLQRCGKSCRLRWTNYLRPDIKRGRFSFEEEETIIQLHSVLGNKWSAIAGRLPGRTDNEIKNYWNTHIRKRLLRMGIDPVTHSPRLDLLDLSSILTSNMYHNNQATAMTNPELLRLATSLMSSQSHADNRVGNYYAEAGLDSFDPTRLIQDQSCYAQHHPANQQSMIQIQALQQQMPGYGSVDDLLFTGFYGEGRINNSVTFGQLNGQNPSMNSVISTPSSSPNHFNNSNVYINSSCTSTTEDERENNNSNSNSITDYCSDLTRMMKFEIPETHNVNPFIY